ncbi:SDR family NAD(P)-dependent oxidoreductase [Chloroflexota bacterium]
MRLDGRVALVTGGNRGIGRAVSLAFAREGAKVAAVGRNASTCDQLVAEIKAGGGNAVAIQADVSQEADVAAMVSTAMERFERIDILVNNAAVNHSYRAVVDLTLDEWNSVVGTNLTGSFLCCRAVVPMMIAQRYGKIINVSSRGGRKGEAGRSPYGPTKAAIINFTECLAAEVKEHGIDVNAICPAAVATDMLREKTNDNVPSYAMPPEDIASVLVFLASDESRAITATAIDAYGAGNPLFGSHPSPVRPK